jgi:ATP-dependent exoDNAse (exonuclease V) beta subunit
VFGRSEAELNRARAAVEAAGLHAKLLDEHVETASGQVSIGTMHLAKGLEFRAVAVMACDDEVIPLQGRIETVGDDADLQEVYDTERYLLYVACTRARDHRRRGCNWSCGAPSIRARSAGADQRSCEMTLCPIALLAGCKKYPAFSVCPLKSVIGDYKTPTDAEAKQQGDAA